MPALDAALRDTIRQGGTEFFELRVDLGTMLLQIAEGGEAGGHGQRIAAQRAGLVDGTEGRELIHQGALAAEDADRQSAADDFAEGEQVGIEAIQLTGAAQSHAESGHHFIDNEQRAVFCRERAQAFEIPWRRRDAAGVADDGFDDDGGDLSGMRRKRSLDRSEIVVGQSQGEMRDFLRNSGRAGNAEGGDAGAGFDQQAIGVAVIAAFELDDDFPARGGPRQADRRHGGLGAGADEAQLLDRGIAGDDFLCQVALRRPWTLQSWRCSQRPSESLRPPEEKRGRGSWVPRNRSSQYSGCHRRPRDMRPRRAATNGGSPPTAAKARTGELTPPGNSFSARCRSAVERVNVTGMVPV